MLYSLRDEVSLPFSGAWADSCDLLESLNAIKVAFDIAQVIGRLAGSPVSWKSKLLCLKKKNYMFQVAML